MLTSVDRKPQGGIKDLAQGRFDIYMMRPADLHIKAGWNSRIEEDAENQAHIEQLAASIAENGVKTPLTVYWENDKVYVSDGHCRLAAVRRVMESGAPIEAIPCQVEPRYSSDEERVVSQITRNSGKPFTPLETGRVCKRLLDFGWSESKIASKIGVGIRRVQRLLEFQASPTALIDMVTSGEVSATLAEDTVRLTKGDMAEATESLRMAVARAKERGKSHATKKDLVLKTSPLPKGKTALEREITRAAYIKGGKATLKVLEAYKPAANETSWAAVSSLKDQVNALLKEART